MCIPPVLVTSRSGRLRSFGVTNIGPVRRQPIQALMALFTVVEPEMPTNVDLDFADGMVVAIKCAFGAVQQLLSPILNLIGMDVELLGKFSQDFIFLDRCRWHLDLKTRRMISPLSFRLLLLHSF